MKTTRSNVFETNSSSSHSFTVSRSAKLIKPEVTEEELESGIINLIANEENVHWVRGSEKDYDPYYLYCKDFRSKLHYVFMFTVEYITNTLYPGPFKEILSEEYVNNSTNEYLTMLKKVIKDTLGMDLVFHKNPAHYSYHLDSWDTIAGSCGDPNMDTIFCDEDTLKQFLFSEESYVESFGNGNI